MIQKEWDPERVRDRLQLQAIRARRPLSCTLELTHRCNFRCRMCYIRMTDAQAEPFGRMRTVEEWLDMAGQLLEAGVMFLTLSGGECTQYPGFERLYGQLAQMGFRITVMTNAAAYSDAVRDVFRKYPPDYVSITLYGGSNETYRSVTGDPRGLDKTVENIRFFRSIGVPVGLTFTMIRQNVRDYPKVGALCAELGISYLLITDISGHRYNGAFSEAMESRLSPAERACVAVHAPAEVEKAMEEARELERELEGVSIPAMTEGPEWPPQDICIGSRSGCAISWNGDMQTCVSMLGYRCVKPFETGFETAWTQLRDAHAETFRYASRCRTCAMVKECRHNCPGRRFEGTGSPRKADPYTCEYTRLMRILREGTRQDNGTEDPEGMADGKAEQRARERCG